VKPVLDRARILELRALVRREVPVARSVQDFAMRLVLATHPDGRARPRSVKRYVRFGPRPAARRPSCWRRRSAR
jgi:MoxR-like ATPase